MSIALVSSVLVLACWYKTTAIEEMGEGEQDGMSSIKVGMTGEVYVELVVEVIGGMINMLS